MADAAAGGPVLAVVPVLSGAALRPVAGRPLLRQALDLLPGLDVVVPAGPTELDAVRALAAGAEVRAAGAGLLGALRAALAARPGDGPVLLLDPLQVRTPPQLVPAVLEALRGTATAAGSGPYLEPVTLLAGPGGAAGGAAGSAAAGGPPEAVVPVRPVTDTLKRVGADGAVVATEDREQYRWALTPQAFRREPLAALLRAPGPAGADGDGPGVRPGLLPRLLARHGARVAVLAAAVDVLRADDEDGLALAAAVHGP